MHKLCRTQTLYPFLLIFGMVCSWVYHIIYSRTWSEVVRCRTSWRLMQKRSKIEVWAVVNVQIQWEKKKLRDSFWNAHRNLNQYVQEECKDKKSACAEQIRKAYDVINPFSDTLHHSGPCQGAVKKFPTRWNMHHVRKSATLAVSQRQRKGRVWRVCDQCKGIRSGKTIRFTAKMMKPLRGENYLCGSEKCSCYLQFPLSFDAGRDCPTGNKTWSSGKWWYGDPPNPLLNHRPI